MNKPTAEPGRAARRGHRRVVDPALMHKYFSMLSPTSLCLPPYCAHEAIKELRPNRFNQKVRFGICHWTIWLRPGSVIRHRRLLQRPDQVAAESAPPTARSRSFENRDSQRHQNIVRYWAGHYSSMIRTQTYDRRVIARPR